MNEPEEWKGGLSTLSVRNGTGSRSTVNLSFLYSTPASLQPTSPQRGEAKAKSILSRNTEWIANRRRSSRVLPSPKCSCALRHPRRSPTRVLGACPCPPASPLSVMPILVSIPNSNLLNDASWASFLDMVPSSSIEILKTNCTGKLQRRDALQPSALLPFGL